MYLAFILGGFSRRVISPTLIIQEINILLESPPGGCILNKGGYPRVGSFQNTAPLDNARLFFRPRPLLF